MATQPTHTARKGQDAEFNDVDVDGALEVVGVLTATGGVVGDVTGDLTGDITGDITGDVTGDLTGDVVGEHRHSSQELTASGAVTINSGVLLLNHASTIIAATLDAPTVGDELYIINNSASGTAAHTVTTAAGVTWDGTNNTATLNAPDEALHVIAISATRWFILENIGTVGLTSV